jgi:hypothetical protein
MTRKEKKIKQIRTELKRFTDRIAEYQIQFNADGYVDPREQAQLDRMNRKINEINTKLTKVYGGTPAPTPEPTPTPTPAPIVEETAENPISANPDGLVGDRNVFVYKDVTELHYNKITELYKTGKVGSVDENSDVHWNDVTQGGAGDCYFLSAIGAVAKADPSLLKKLIKGPFKDGSYEVTLHIKDVEKFDWRAERAPQKVTITSEFLVQDNGEPIYAGSGDTELWVMLLEKAYALLRGKEQRDMSHLGQSYDALDAGWGEEGIEVLTGKEASILWVPDLPLERIKAEISSALAEKRPIATGTIEGPPPGVKANAAQVDAQKANIVFLHEYFVLAFDGSKITLQNPWNAETVDGDGRGDITISIADYKRWFRDLCIQDK